MAAHALQSSMVVVLHQHLHPVVVEYCPDPQNDFNIEIEDGAQGTVTWSDSGWTIHGQRRVSSKASFDFSGGGAQWDMDLSQAHNGVNNNFYVTYPYEPNTGKDKYCDSCGNHDYQGRGCAELDWTENNGQCHQATTWHDDPAGISDCAGHGGEGGLSSNIHCSAMYDTSGGVNINIGGNSHSGSAHGDMRTRGAVIYSSQWKGWSPGDCGDGDLGSSVYTVSNIKLTGKVLQGPEPRRCNPLPPTPPPSPPPTPDTPTPVPSPTDCPGGDLASCIGFCPTSPADAFQACVSVCQDRCGSCTGGDDGSDLATCVGGCPSDGFHDCVSCCSDKFPSDVIL